MTAQPADFADGRPLGVLLLSGARHGRYLLPPLLANPAVRLVAIADEPAIADRYRQLQLQLAATHGVPYVEDVPAALARPEVDAVCLAAEYVRHGRLALTTLAAGKHLLLDKPMATTLPECRRIAAVARASAPAGLKVLTISRHTAPAVQSALAAIRAGRIGRVRALHGEFLSGTGPGEDYDPVRDAGWHPRWTGGGELLNFLLYPLTNVRLLSGLEVEQAQCFGGALFTRAHREFGVEDTATVVLRLAGGAVADLMVTRCHTPAHPSRHDIRVTVVGDDGLIEVDEHRPSLAVYGTVATGVRHTYLEQTDVIGILIQEQIDCFVRWVREDVPPGQTVDDSLRVMEAVFATAESLRTGQVIQLPLNSVGPDRPPWCV